MTRDHSVAHRQATQILSDTYTRALENPEALVKLLCGGLGESLVEEALLRQPRLIDDLRHTLKKKIDEMGLAPPPEPTEHWAIEPGYEGIEQAQLVVVNVREGEDRARAEALVEDVARLRKDKAVFRDVLGIRGNKLPVTAGVGRPGEPEGRGG